MMRFFALNSLLLSAALSAVTMHGVSAKQTTYNGVADLQFNIDGSEPGTCRGSAFMGGQLGTVEILFTYGRYSPTQFVGQGFGVTDNNGIVFAGPFDVNVDFPNPPTPTNTFELFGYMTEGGNLVNNQDFVSGTIAVKAGTVDFCTGEATGDMEIVIETE